MFTWILYIDLDQIHILRMLYPYYMAEALELGYLVWAVIVTVIAVVLAMVVIYIQRKHHKDIQALQKVEEAKRKSTLVLGQGSVKGEMTEILAHFKLLTEYEQLALFHSVSKQFSIDLMGIKKDSVDFIEVKSTVNKLSDLSKKEQSVKKLIDEKKVRYRIIEGKFPDFEIKEKELD